jgi:DNA-binding LytR/AlgR family response regulator
MISSIAIDDEPIALTVIKSHAEKIPFLNLKAVFTSAANALTYIDNEAVDLVFLDIRMPDLSGIDLAKRINKRTGIIFTTAYSDHAIEAFELAAIDYLLKPIGFERFSVACARAEEQLGFTGTAEKQQSIFVKDGYEWIKLNVETLLYAEASDNYVVFHELNRKTISRMTVTEAAEKLPSDVFVRVHKSFLVNIRRIDKISSNQVVINGKSIPMSDKFKSVLLGKLKDGII